MRSTVLLGTAKLLFWVAAFWLLFRKAEARQRATVHGDGRIEFARNAYSYLAWILITVSLAWLATRGLLFGKREPLALLQAVGLGLLPVMLLTEFPGTIMITDVGLEQLYWLRRNKRIQWEDIVEINTGEKIRSVTITADDGTKIVHSAGLPDRARLLLELKQHCGDNLPPDFPREPLPQPHSLTKT
jgi:hypothetical protein